MRVGVVGFLALFALGGCTAYDTASEPDASFDSGNDSSDAGSVIDTGPDSGCVVEYPSYPNLCCGSLAFGCGYVGACGMTLDQAGTWGGGPGGACVYESTNVIDGDVAVTSYGTDTQAILYFDVATHMLVGIGGYVANPENLFCYGFVPPPACDPEGDYPDGSVCSDWNYQLLAQGTYECFNDGLDGGVDSGDAD